MKHYYAIKHADYNLKLRAGIRAFSKREADIPGDSESGNVDVQLSNSVTRTLDSTKNVSSGAALRRTSEHAETVSANDTTSCNRDENTEPSKVISTRLPIAIKDRPLIFSQVAFSLSDTRTGKILPHRRRTGDLATLDPNVTSPEILGKERKGSDGDAWALPKGEKRWGVSSVM